MWKTVCKFEILSGEHGCRVLWTKEKWDHIACYQRSVQKPVSLMVQGCIIAYVIGSLHVCKGTIMAERCMQPHPNIFETCCCNQIQNEPVFFFKCLSWFVFCFLLWINYVILSFAEHCILFLFVLYTVSQPFTTVFVEAAKPRERETQKPVISLVTENNRSQE